MVNIRKAEEADVGGIRDLFLAAYGHDYAYPSFYDLQILKKMVFDDSTLVLVAEDEETKTIAGTASVIFDLGEYGDLAGEFGRLVVHPEFGHRGIGNKLMEARLEHASVRLHLGFVENRTPHPYSQKISDKFGFAAVGFMPQKHLFTDRESLALYIKHFGDALRFRRNNPKLVPEAILLAQHVLGACDIDRDAVIDEVSPAYEESDGINLVEMKTKGYAGLLRIERSRPLSKEVFGPARVLQGMFRLEASHSKYTLAYRDEVMVGAIGYTVDEKEKTAKIFELVCVHEEPIKLLLKDTVEKCRRDSGVEYIEIDVSAYSPRMQRTLIELEFVPVGYLPAFTFVGAERLDSVRMARVYVPVDMSNVSLHEATKPVADIVLDSFSLSKLVPQIGDILPQHRQFEGFTEQQTRALASIAEPVEFLSGDEIFSRGEPETHMYLVLEGEIEIFITDSGNDKVVGKIKPGECLGESTLLVKEPHSVSARAITDVTTASIEREALQRLIRRKPDLGTALYKNLALGLYEKLRKVDRKIS